MGFNFKLVILIKDLFLSCDVSQIVNFDAIKFLTNCY